jgi:membrane-bound lytic murein transglycosylase B
MMRTPLFSFFLALVFLAATASGAVANFTFEQWVRQFRPEALAQGVSPGTFDAAFAGLQPLPRVIELFERQPEVKLTLEEYLSRVVPTTRVERGRQLLAENKVLLERIGNFYGVPPRLIVALWGVESDFGRRQGDYNVVAALATLSWSGKRAAFFKQELIAALKIIDQGHAAPQNLLGSWAGALGQCQFMPSNFLRLTVDHDGDGRRDIWNSRSDVFASIANYMNKVNWRTGQSWAGRSACRPGSISKPISMPSARSSSGRNSGSEKRTAAICLRPISPANCLCRRPVIGRSWSMKITAPFSRGTARPSLRSRSVT